MGIGSESDCFFGTVEQDLIGFRFSDSDAGLKVEKKTGDVDGAKVYVETHRQKCWLERSKVWKFCL